MPLEKADPTLTSSNSASCPKYGAETEPIETGAERSQMREMYLCPSCYLLMWSDNQGLHIRQGIPMNKV